MSNQLVNLNLVPTGGEVISGNDKFKVQFLESKTSKLASLLAVASQVSVFNLSSCEEVLRKHYNISNDAPFQYSKIDFDDSLNTTTSSVNKTNGCSVSVDIYYQNKRLNKSICNIVPAKTNIPCNPLKNEIDQIKKGFTEFKITGRKLSQIDISNKNDPIFGDRCIKFTNNNGIGLTVNERRSKFYPNSTISCDADTGTNETCVFEGLDENYYAKCTCKGVIETKNLFERALLESLSEININIVLCQLEVLSFVNYYN